ncbi:hypothetical protein GN244_ATG03148 [Phytophthora infestans]|uniref:RxLR effector protein n=1 Tax=Phytophthora infestans TaxID=4787 RepID=A0A833TPS6_PHYIN|nr:hypothetical protein GN244_ATG03148 [Phytophthora infestans]
MYWFHALLVTVFAFLASTDSLSAAAHSGQRKTGLTKSSTTAIVSNAKRSLRFNDKENGVVGGEDIIEGRGGGKLSDYFGRFGGMKSKMLQWARAGKSDDFSNKNYKHNKQFQEALLDISLKKMTSTSEIWRRMGFEKLKTIDDVYAAHATDAFQLYMRYARHFDDAALKNNVKHKTPIPVISDDVTYAEATARISRWRLDDRPADYVKAALRLDNLSPAALLERQYFDLYVIFLKSKTNRMFSAGESKEKVESFVKTALNLNSMSPEDIPTTIGKYYSYLLVPKARTLD